MSLPLIDKIDPWPICTNHFKTLVRDDTGQRSVSDLLLFYGSPLALFAIVAGLRVGASDAAVNIMTNALALLAGLLFNLLVLLHGLALPDESQPLRATARRLASQIYANISYAILISLI